MTTTAVAQVAVRCENLVQIYGADDARVIALQGVDLEIASGDAVAFLGPSGSGKTTLLWLLAGLLRPSAGRLWVYGHDVARLTGRDLAKLRRRAIGVVLQNPGRNLLPYATVRQNVAMVAGRRRSREVEDLLAAVGLQAVAHRHAGSLSGGEQQRLAVAVAASRSPRLLLADEPTSQLDRASAGRVVDVLLDLRERTGMTLVVVTHDAAVSKAFRRTVTIRDGRVGAEGRGSEDLIVVGRHGSVQLPPEAQQVLPPGSLARVRVSGDGVELRRAPELDGGASRRAGPGGIEDGRTNDADR